MKKSPAAKYSCENPDCGYTGFWDTFKMDKKQIGSMIDFNCPKCGEYVCSLDTYTSEKFTCHK